MVLNEEYNYPFERMEIEYSVSFGREKKRADIVIFDKQDTHRNNLKCVCILCHYNQDEYHQSKFEKPRLKTELTSFVNKYRKKLIEIENQYIAMTRNRL